MEKGDMVAVGVSHDLDSSSGEMGGCTQELLELPKSYNVCGLKFLAYSHPRIQTAMLGGVVFLTVGMYHVITSLGGAGQQTAAMADTANITLYAVFMVFCLATPACLNYFGLRASLCFGSIGYAAYAASLWCYNRTGNEPFVIFGGAWCGLSAAFLWTAERTGVIAYAPEGKKGLYVSIFWTIYQIGTVVGSAIPVGQNWNQTSSSRVNDGTYIGLFILMLLGAVVALLLLPTNKVVREDGKPVTMPSQLTIKQHVMSCWDITKKKKWIVLMWPLAFGTNYYVIYQSNRYNGLTFSVRGRSLNTLISGCAQVCSTWTMTALMDWVPLPRRQRAYLGLVFNLLLLTGVWIGGYYAMVDGLPDGKVIDVYDHGYGVRAFLYAMYGYMDGCYNTFALWFIGALSNDFRELSVYVSMFTLWQSCFEVIAYALDFKAASTGFMFGSIWFILVFGLLTIVPIIQFWMTETSVPEETLEGVPVSEPTVTEK